MNHQPVEIMKSSDLFFVLFLVSMAFQLGFAIGCYLQAVYFSRSKIILPNSVLVQPRMISPGDVRSISEKSVVQVIGCERVGDLLWKSGIFGT